MTPAGMGGLELPVAQPFFPYCLALLGRELFQVREILPGLLAFFGRESAPFGEPRLNPLLLQGGQLGKALRDAEQLLFLEVRKMVPLRSKGGEHRPLLGTQLIPLGCLFGPGQGGQGNANREDYCSERFTHESKNFWSV